MKIKLTYLLTIVPFICFIAGYCISHFIVGTTAHPAPNIIGLTIHEAVKQTSKNHVTLQLIAEKECSGIAPGTILTQKPAPGRLIKPNQTVLVTISKQTSSVSAPNLLDLSSPKIQETGKQLGIKIKEFMIQSNNTMDNICICQHPSPDTLLTDNKMIAYIAKPSDNVYIMPNFIGKQLNDALASLKHYHCTTIITHKQKELSYPYQQGIIIGQKPRSGTLINFNKKQQIQLEIDTYHA